ncbi:MAG: pentapeptide repeat-containing protein [Methanothrix sp.]|nr:pentapeptide repeat-containing protein [Methanothrix sp.]
MKIITVLIFALIISVAGGSNESINIVHANEIIEKFKKGMDLNYDSKYIDGNLFLNNSLNSKNEPIISNITIENSIIDGDINFSYMKFNKVSFFNSTFIGNFKASNSHFLNDTNFLNCKFQGFTDFIRSQFYENADFGGASFNYSYFNSILVKKYANFKNSKFLRRTFFGGASFRGSSFERCVFSKFVDFSASQFDSMSNFKSICFNDGARFSGSNFNYDLKIDNSTAARSIDFNNVVFKGVAEFQNSNFTDFSSYGCEFRERCDFRKSIFNKNTTISENEFIKDVDFSSSEFKGDAEFKGSHFSGNLNFYSSKFKGDAGFRYSQFLGDSDFSGAEFDKTVDFSNCIFNDTLLLRRSNFNGSVCLMDSRFKKDVFADDAVFNGNLNMNRTQFSNIYIRWFNIKNGIQYNETAYYLLIKNFKNLGLFSDANECYYALMSEMRNQTVHQSFSGQENKFLISLLYSLSQILYGFGTKPELPLAWSGLFVIAFALYWYYIYQNMISGSIYDRYGTMKRNIGAPVNKKIYSELLRLLDAIKFSLSIFLSGTTLFFDPPEIPKRLTGSRVWMKRIYLAERTLGAGFFFLFFFAISKMLLSY